MSNPWLRIGAWAAEVERVDAEVKQLAAASTAPPPAFPSLSASKPSRKKKPETLSFSEFTMGVSLGPGSRSRSIADARGLTLQEKMRLPTAPRDRSGEEEYRGGLGGAFRDYRVGPDRFNREWSGAGFERERDSGVSLRDREREQPSRADGDSDWCSSKKPLSAFGGYNDQRRRSRMSDRHLPSRADEVGKWGSANKPPLLASARYEERRETFDRSRSSRADEVENWSASKRSVPAGPDWRPAARYDSLNREAGADSERWTRSQQTRQEPQRRRLVLAPRTLSTSSPLGPRGDTEVHYPVPADSLADISDSVPPPQPKPKPNPFGSARPREVVLAEKCRDWRRSYTDHGVKERNSRPSSGHSSRAETVRVSAQVAVKPRLKVNPFGDAKPREVLLEERGKDWRKIDFELEHRGVDRRETEDEVRLKEEIKALMELSKDSVVVGSVKLNGVVTEKDLHYESARKSSVQEEIRIKERKLEQLIRFLDDKVRFSQRAGERPGSRSGRYEAHRASNLFEKPRSASGQADSRGFECSDGPWPFSGHGEGERDVELFEGPWSDVGHLEVSRNVESLDRTSPWARQ